MFSELVFDSYSYTSHPTNYGQLSADAIGSPGQAFRRMQKAIAVGGATCLRDGRL